MGAGEDGPLKPVYNQMRPPWIGHWTGRDYKGRLDWWNELGFQVDAEMSRKFVPAHYPIKERNQAWYDPKVPDGQSNVNVTGQDSFYHGNRTKKGDEAMNQFEYQDYLMKNSVQYKNIASKYNLSKEHPGIDVSPDLNSLSYTPKEYLGFEGAITWPSAKMTWGPRFHDKPMNEGCFEKGGALAKYAAMGTFIYSSMLWRKTEDKRWNRIRFGEVFKVYAKSLPLPLTLSFGYGVAICTAATLRNKDDVWNPFYASLFTGITLATIKGNMFTSAMFTGSIMLIGQIWHYQRVTQYGISTPVENQKLGGFWGTGPRMYETRHFGNIKIGDECY
ncbi:unnamed protein product [Bursaphelenchus okinawaensis]|uniref:Uncharacterized protein n=1 Tax=Bursaphelenchus okinawaensis TaxID=465554 RepID=A0A811K3Q4_9BILA|nr:unnamed protein product [Bursaphelenchus okinawaensis]CAG9091108.1 unnamed protein product [Bursaphelenchus okinawaensis]